MRLDTKVLQTNIQAVQALIEKNQLKNTNVDLIAVTKYVDSPTIRQMNQLGLSKFAENRAEDLLKKQEDLKELTHELEWHFVGRLQRRPVRKIINKIDYLHSLDRLSLIEEIDKKAKAPVKCFLQVNISGEEQKAGFKPEEVLQTIKRIKDYPNIYIVGLMTMAPYEEKAETVREYFKQLRTLQAKVSSLKLAYAPCTELSMGMSDDYPIAIQEGATMIRIGRALYK